MIVVSKGLGKFDVLFITPFELKAKVLTIFLFYIIYFLQLGSSPKKRIPHISFLIDLFDAFTYHEILPKYSNVLTDRQWLKLSNYCIANSIIIEVQFIL